MCPRMSLFYSQQSWAAALKQRHVTVDYVFHQSQCIYLEDSLFHSKSSTFGHSSKLISEYHFLSSIVSRFWWTNPHVQDKFAATPMQWPDECIHF